MAGVNGIEVRLKPAPWIPPAMLNSGAMYDALQEAADSVVARLGGENEWEWETTSASGGWPDEATIVIGVHNVDLDNDIPGISGGFGI